jgi:glycosyltransferase involved in cell wall biosynthesis
MTTCVREATETAPGEAWRTDTAAVPSARRGDTRPGRSFVINGKFLGARPTGVQRVAAELVRALDRALAAGEGGAGWQGELLVPPGVAVALPLQRIAVRSVGRLSGTLWEQLDLPRFVNRRLLLNFCNFGPLAVANAVTMIHDAQTFSTPESYSVAFRQWYRFAQPILGRRNRRILTVSEFSRREIAHYGVAPADRVDVVHNGVDHVDAIEADPTAAARLAAPGRPFVLALANTQAHKNLRVLLAAFADRRLAGIDLLLFGAATAAALEAVHGGPLPANVRPLGILGDDELKGLMQAALGLACPSRTEGFGLPPLEAMSVGCPTVVAPCGALPEVCGAAALYADPDDPDAWAAAIAALQHPATRPAAAVLRQRAASFRWDASARRLLALMEGLTT